MGDQMDQNTGHLNNDMEILGQGDQMWNQIDTITPSDMEILANVVMDHLLQNVQSPPPNDTAPCHQIMTDANVVIDDFLQDVQSPPPNDTAPYHQIMTDANVVIDDFLQDVQSPPPDTAPYLPYHQIMNDADFLMDHLLQDVQSPPPDYTTPFLPYHQIMTDGQVPTSHTDVRNIMRHRSLKNSIIFSDDRCKTFDCFSNDVPIPMVEDDVDVISYIMKPGVGDPMISKTQSTQYIPKPTLPETESNTIQLLESGPENSFCKIQEADVQVVPMEQSDTMEMSKNKVRVGSNSSGKRSRRLSPNSKEVSNESDESVQNNPGCSKSTDSLSKKDKNNESSKKSRERRKNREKDMLYELHYLEEKNDRLKCLSERLEKATKIVINTVKKHSFIKKDKKLC